MKNIVTFTFIISILNILYAQVTPTPASAQKVPILLQHATLHIGNGKLFEDTDVLLEKGKISKIGKNLPVLEGTKSIDVAGKHLYPGLIILNSNLGLEEIEAVRATSDAREVGVNNPNVRAIVGYNTDSKVIPTLRSNGILLAQIAPTGNGFAGTSAVVQLDAWNYEDAVIVADEGVYLEWFQMNFSATASKEQAEAQEKNRENAEANLHQKMQEAIAYKLAQESGKPFTHNLMLAALVPVLKKEKRLYIRAITEKQIIAAVAFAKQYDLNIALVGAEDAYLQTDLLKRNNIPVILYKPHQLPMNEDDAIDLPYQMPKLLHDAGIIYGYDIDVFWNERNLPFMAGTAAAYGITKEEALKALTSYPAQILGIDKRVGTIEDGKDATLIISEGDVLDMRSSKIIYAFIEGREINLSDLHKELYEKFQAKYK